MKKLVLLTFIALASSFAHSQTKTNEAITKKINDLGSSRSIRLNYDQGSNVSKLMGVSENFADAGRTGAQAINFAIGFMYVGRELTAAPQSILFTFWVLTKKPRFAANHELTLSFGKQVGPARYAAKPREDMEYLNFEIARADLAALAAEPNPSFKLGEFQLSLTRGQKKMIADLLTLSDPAL